MEVMSLKLYNNEKHENKESMNITKRPYGNIQFQCAYQPSTTETPTAVTLPITTLNHILQAPESQLRKDDPRPHCEAQFSEKLAAITLVDSGACINLLGSYLFTLIAHVAPHAVMSQVVPSDKQVVGAGGLCNLDGKVKLAFRTTNPKHTGKVFATWMYLCPRLAGNILFGMPAINLMYGEKSLHDFFGAVDLNNYLRNILTTESQADLPEEYSANNLLEDGRIKTVKPMPPYYNHNAYKGFEYLSGQIYPVTDELDNFAGRITPNDTIELEDSEDGANDTIDLASDSDDNEEEQLPVDQLISKPTQFESMFVGGMYGRQEIPAGKTLPARIRLPQAIQKDTFQVFSTKLVHNLKCMKITSDTDEVELDANQKVVRVNLKNNTKSNISINKGSPICLFKPIVQRTKDSEIKKHKEEDLLQEDLRPEIGLDDEFKRKAHSLIDKMGTELWAKNEFDIGKIEEKYAGEIHKLNDAPIYEPQHNFPISHQPYLKKWKENMVKRKIIERKPCPHNNTRMFAVAKGQRPAEDGSFKVKDEKVELRIVFNYIPLNKVCKDDKYSIKDVRSCLQDVAVKKNKYFSAFDFRSAFTSVPLKKEYRHLTAFTIPGDGQYVWNRMPQGYKNSPAIWSRAAVDIFGDIEGLSIYVDDCIIYSETQEEHLVILEKFLRRVKEAGLKLNAKKSFIGRDQIEFLGYCIGVNGVYPSESKVDKIARWKAPQKIQDIRSFLGLTNYFQMHIPKYAMLAGMLHRLTRKSSGYKGGDMPLPAQKAFYTLKTALMSRPVVRPADPDKEFIIMTDAATGDEDYAGGIGGLLMQQDEKGHHYVIAYESKSLNKAQERYTPFMLEMASVVHCLEKWEHYTIGRKVTVICDNLPVCNIATNVQRKTINQLQAKMMEYNINIVHKKGNRDFPADSLSRLVHLGEQRSQHVPIPLEDLIDFDSSGNVALPITEKPTSTFVPPSGVRERMLTMEEPWWTDLPQGLEPKSRLGQGINLSFEQARDPTCHEILQFLLTGRSTKDGLLSDYFLQNESPNFKTSDGILLRKDPSTQREQVVVPARRIPELIMAAHNSTMGGHMSAHKTEERLKTNFWFPNMHTTCKLYIAKCANCQRVNKHYAREPMKNMTRPSNPMEVIALDLMEFSRSESGNKYLLNIMCLHSRFARCIPIKDKTAETVLKAMYDQWFTVHGLPKKIISDNGREWANNHVQSWIKSNNITWIFTSSYTPRSDIVERLNRTIKRYMRAMVPEHKQAHWDDYASSAQISYNSCIHRALKHSPFAIVYLREPRYPWLYHDQEDIKPSEEEWLKRAEQFKDKIYNEAAIADQKLKELNKSIWDKKKGTTTTFGRYQRGDLIWYLNPLPGTGKFSKTYLPAIFEEYMGSHTASIKILNGSNKQTTLDRIKRRSKEEDSTPLWELQQKQSSSEVTRDTYQPKSNQTAIRMERFNYPTTVRDFLAKKRSLPDDDENEEEVVAKKKMREEDKLCTFKDLIQDSAKIRATKRSIPDQEDDNSIPEKVKIREQISRKRQAIFDPDRDSPKKIKMERLMPIMLILAQSSTSSLWSKGELEKAAFDFIMLRDYYSQA